MNKFVFYQTNKTAWLCDKNNRERFVYEKEITPENQEMSHDDYD